jgi:hypothetical protein
MTDFFGKRTSEADADGTDAATGLAARPRGPEATVTLRLPAGELVAKLRNIAPLGLMAEADAELAPGMRVAALLGGGQATGTIRWVRGKAFGVKFDRALSFDLVRSAGAGGRPEPRAVRAPRLETRRPAIITCGAAERSGTVQNVSKTGLMVETHLPLLPGQTVRVTAEGWPSMAGQVRWCRNGGAGVLFSTPLTQAQLDALPK